MVTSFTQKADDELFPMKDGKILMSDIDYVDVWQVRKEIWDLKNTRTTKKVVENYCSNTVCMYMTGDGSPEGLWKSKEYWCVQLHNPTTGKAAVCG